MPRPRQLKLKDGEVSLNNFSVEVADKLESYLEKFDVSTETTQKDLNTSSFKDIAVGIHFNKVKKHFEIVEVGYDTVTNQSKILNIKNAGDSRRAAVNSFKVSSVNSILKKEIL